VGSVFLERKELDCMELMLQNLVLEIKRRLKELIKEGKNQVIVQTQIDKKGKFGRLLGELFNSEVDAYKTYNEILVDEGHAVEYFGKKR